MHAPIAFYDIIKIEPISKMALKAKSSEFHSEAAAAGTIRIGNTMSFQEGGRSRNSLIGARMHF